MPKVLHYNNIYFLSYVHPSIWKFVINITETIEYVKKLPTFKEKHKLHG